MMLKFGRIAAVCAAALTLAAATIPSRAEAFGYYPNGYGYGYGPVAYGGGYSYGGLCGCQVYVPPPPPPPPPCCRYAPPPCCAYDGGWNQGGYGGGGYGGGYYGGGYRGGYDY